MVEEWNLTKIVDDRHCFQNKEMIELLITDIANLEKQYNCDKEHSDTIRHMNIQQHERDSRMNPKYENDFLIMMQVVMLRMKEEKASLKNISFLAILRALVNEGQIQLKGWSSCRDRGGQMKARVKQMLKEWNLTKTVDNRHYCSPENKEIFELCIADIANLEKQYSGDKQKCLALVKY